LNDLYFFFSSRRRHTRSKRDWSSDVCSSDLDGKIKHIFKEIFKAGLDIQKDDRQKELLVSRKRKAEDTIIDINGAKFGNGEAHFITGPCAVESYEQVASVAKEVKDK